MSRSRRRRRTAPEASGDHSFRRRGDRRGGRPRVADRLRHPRRRRRRGSGADDGGTIRRDRHPRQQRERDQPHRHRRDADEAIRSHVRGQCARHVRLLAGLPAASPRRPRPRDAIRTSSRWRHRSTSTPKWFRDHVAYTMAKYGMSMCVLGMAAEFRADGIGVNALWPHSVIATAAVAMIPGAAGETDRMRRPEIVADAAIAILDRDARTAAGRFFIDEEVLAEAGIADLERYAIKPGTPLLPDLLFVSHAHVVRRPPRGRPVPLGAQDLRRVNDCRSRRRSWPASRPAALRCPVTAWSRAREVCDCRCRRRRGQARRRPAAHASVRAAPRFWGLPAGDCRCRHRSRPASRRAARRPARHSRRGRAGVRPAPMAVAAPALLALTATGAGGRIAPIRPIGTVTARRTLGPLAATRPLRPG